MPNPDKGQLFWIQKKFPDPDTEKSSGSRSRKKLRVQIHEKVLNPDPIKSSGSDRIQIHNTSLEIGWLWVCAGNLLNRLTSLALNPAQERPGWRPEFAAYETELSRELEQRLAGLPEAVEAAYESLHFYQGIVAIMDMLRLTNSFVQVRRMVVL